MKVSVQASSAVDSTALDTSCKRKRTKPIQVSVAQLLMNIHYENERSMQKVHIDVKPYLEILIKFEISFTNKCLIKFMFS